LGTVPPDKQIMRTVWRFFDLRRRRRDDDLRDELQTFVDELTDRHIARGMSPREARRAAMVETGGVQQVRELTREQWAGHALETLARDVRSGLRSLTRVPGCALVIVATLALAIGANATVFSVMHAVLWQPLHYPQAERLVVVDADADGVRGAGVSHAESRDLRLETGVFDALAWLTGVDAHVNAGGEMERVAAASVTNDGLPLLGAAPLALGRTLDDRLDGGFDSRVRNIVISHQLWERRLRSDPDVIGRHIEVNNLDVEIVGVLRKDFRVFLPAAAGMPEIVDVWFPSGFTTDRRNRGPLTIARLAGSVTRADAATRLDALSRRYVQDHPAMYAKGELRLFVAPLQEVLTGGVARMLWVLAGAVGFVLVIACVNVGNLMLARARARQREFAVRRALGAARVRLVRQLLTESALLSLAGAAAGFALAYGGVALIEWLGPAHLPRQSTIAVTGDVALFAAALAVAVTVLFSLIPAFADRDDQPAALRSGRITAQAPGMRRTQRTLVVAEIALSIVPLIAAGLMLRSFVNLLHAPLGLTPAHVLSAKVPHSLRQYPEFDDKWRLYQAVLDRVRQVPGVEDVSAGGPVPFDTWQQTRPYSREGEPLSGQASIQSILPGYLHVIGTKLIAGREFTRDDLDRQRPVVIVDARIARALWPDGAIGKRLKYGRSGTLLEVIGVSEPVRVTRVRDDDLPNLFIPYHLFTIEQALVIKTHASAAVLGPIVKQAVEALGTRRPVYDIQPLQAYVDASVGDTRFLMLILGGFALASIALAAIGLYGTMSYLTAQRTQEFGIRMALGASSRRVLREVAGEGMILALVGGGLGFAGALATTGVLAGLLYNVTPFDGVTLASAASAVALVALAAASHPAWRAAGVDPTVALRAE
jgi:predicted permease